MRKTKILAIVAGLSLHSFGLYAQNVPVSTFAETIQAEDLKKHLTYIASDELEGRDTGSEGQRKAAEYIVAQLKSYGLTPIVPTGSGEKSYFQPFTLYKKDWQMAQLEVKGKNNVLFTDYFPNGLVHIPEKKELEIVYLPYGLPDEYAKKDLKGKAVLFWEGSQEGEAKWVGTDGLRAKVEELKKAGAVCFFEISNADANGFKTKTAERRAILSRYNRLVFEPTQDQETAAPTFTVSQSVAAEMTGISVEKLIQARQAKKASSSTSKVTVQLKRGNTPVETMNVMGFLEGTDKKEEVIVISAHFDHVGKDAKGNIYNGADDDGSGTCAVLELAEAFTKAKAAGHGPRR
ncbi:MAG: M28 family peptidase, partial [Spirosomataceae bacterium]